MSIKYVSIDIDSWDCAGCVEARVEYYGEGPVTMIRVDGEPFARLGNEPGREGFYMRLAPYIDRTRFPETAKIEGRVDSMYDGQVLKPLQRDLRRHGIEFGRMGADRDTDCGPTMSEWASMVDAGG